MNSSTPIDRQAKSLERHSDLTRPSFDEHGLNRTLEKAKAELKQLQKDGLEAREKALIKAAEIGNLKDSLLHGRLGSCCSCNPHRGRRGSEVPPTGVMSFFLTWAMRST